MIRMDAWSIDPGWTRSALEHVYETTRMREEAQERAAQQINSLAGSLKARKFGAKLRARSQEKLEDTEEANAPVASIANSDTKPPVDREKWSGLVKWHREGTDSALTPEQLISKRIEQLESGQAKMQQQLQNLTSLLTSGLAELKAGMAR